MVEGLYGKILTSFPDYMAGLEVKLTLQSGTFRIEMLTELEDTGLFRAKELDKEVYHVFQPEKLELTIVKK